MSESVPVAQLVHYPGNARVHDLDAIATSLRHNAQYVPLVVQASTNHVLVGNGTLEAARDLLGWTEVKVDRIDVDDDAARIIVLADNRTSDLADYDRKALLELLEPLEAAGRLEGTALDLDFLDNLRAELVGVPELEEQEFGGDYAEDEDEYAARANKPVPDPGSVKARPLLLMFLPEEHLRFTRLVKGLAEPEEPQAMTVLRALRAAAAA